MIKPQELRIGNKVLRNGIIVSVDNQTFWDVEKYPDQYKPIELTEEWLLKFGFTRQPWGLVIGSLLFKDKNHECKELTLEIGNGFRTTVKYVHQLQNLYFALTGEELTIKE